MQRARIERWVFFFAVVSNAGVARSARAQWDDDGPDTGFGMSASIGAGVFGFTDDATQSFATPGGSWTVRIAVGTRWPVTFEAGYIGSAGDIDALGLDEDALLIGNGVEAIARLNLLALIGFEPRFAFGWVVPYLYTGAAWRHHRVVNDDFNLSSVDGSDHVGEIPVGGGIALALEPLVFDLRGEFRGAFDDDLIRTTAGGVLRGEADLNMWSVSARAGWEF